MKPAPNREAEKFRNHKHSRGIQNLNNGTFQIKGLTIIVSDGGGWDHVSVSHFARCPLWEEMCVVKDLFFKDDEVVMQLHPAKANYVNNHPKCLHLWRPQTEVERRPALADYKNDRDTLKWKMDRKDFERLDECEMQPTPGPIPLPHKSMV